MRIIILIVTILLLVCSILGAQVSATNFVFAESISPFGGGWGEEVVSRKKNLQKILPLTPSRGGEKPCKSPDFVQKINALKFENIELNSPAFGGNWEEEILKMKEHKLKIHSASGGEASSSNREYSRKSNTIQLSLNQVIELAKNQSIASRQANTQKETAYWQYKSFQSNYKPQLTLNGTLPNFNRTFQEVLQPDGTIEFQPVTNNNSDLTFSLSQTIAATGATVFVNSQLQRFDDFDRDFNLYNGLPIGIGIQQPLFAFNPLKWDKKTEPLRFEESKQAYIESLENIGLTAANRFFDFLIAQVNRQIAQSNLSNNDTIYKIALERFDLGKISKNDLLQLRLGVLQSKKSAASAEQSLEISDLQLKSFIAYRAAEQIELALPIMIPDLEIDSDKALQEALMNRGDAIAYKRKGLEAEKEIARAKGENGFQANIFAAFGLSNTAQNIGDVYKSPQDRETIQIGFEIPIMDWGRSKARMETAKANQQLVAYEVEQDRIVFEEEIYTLITLFNMLKDQLALSKEADEIAAERYEIAKNRFFIGNLSITDLTIALQEKDQAKRDYIFSLRDFWQTWLTIRVKTLYDFETQQKIIYTAN